LKVESAFNETAAMFAVLPKTPHMAYLNCEDQPILCNSWGARTGSLWVFEMLPAPAPIDIYLKRLNLTTTTSQTLVDLHSADRNEAFKRLDGYFHPFDGPLAKYGLAVPVGYVFWVFSLVPSWMLMLAISFISRTFMSVPVQSLKWYTSSDYFCLRTRRMENQTNRPRNPAAAAGASAPGGAPPGEPRS
jgi:hypothetical protein